MRVVHTHMNLTGLAARARLAVLCLVLLLLPAVAGAQATVPARTPIDVTKVGPQVGQQVPDFSLIDQSGKTWTRQSIMGARGAMIVFFRSADW